MNIIHYQVIHINDCAGVSFILPEQGITLLRKKNLFCEYYTWFKIFDHQVRYWLLFILLYCFYQQPKQLFFHSALTECSFLIHFKFLFPHTKFIYWSHGSDLRNKAIPNFLNQVDILYKSTQSISDKRFIYRQVPIDRTLFYPEPKIQATAFMLVYPNSEIDPATWYCHTHHLTLDFFQVGFSPILAHTTLAKKLRTTQYYIETKGLYPERSKTFYEAQVCGCICIEESDLQKQTL